MVFVLSTGITQYDLSGNWQGVIIRAGKSMGQGTLLYVDLNVQGATLTGTSREEIYETDNFAVKRLGGTGSNDQISFRQIVVEKSLKTSRTKWCRLSGTLKYDSVTGYLEGNYESTDCRRVIGKIILYRSSFNLSKENLNEVSHIWFKHFVDDYLEGLNAPEIRRIERDNFVFEPVFFDFDKAIIRKEHNDFLNRLTKVVKGHSDLRVQVTGHTDSDGAHGYNDELSKRRAQAIIQYFKDHGLTEDRLKFQYKGENYPVDTNKTSEGKQRNRRVDFEFI
jgi:outer membrane protein OmpA-like peptidoglycan-associated protein